MSFSRIQLQTTREFYRSRYQSLPEHKPVNKTRIFFSMLTFLFSGFMYYIAMHYIPALANPRKVLRFSTETATLPATSNEFDFAEASPLQKLLGSYYKPFEMDRSYMRAGESIKIKYEIPAGTTVKLDIVQCQRIWAVEIFSCRVVNKFNTEKETRRGIATYALGDSGFYHFRHKVDGLQKNDTNRLVWERVTPNPEMDENTVNNPLRPT